MRRKFWQPTPPIVFLSRCRKHATLTITDFFKALLGEAAAGTGLGRAGRGSATTRLSSYQPRHLRQRRSQSRSREVRSPLSGVTRRTSALARDSRDGGCPAVTAGLLPAPLGGPGTFCFPRALPARAAAGRRHLPMSELQKASCGWMGTQVQASTTKSRRLQLHRNTTRKLSHAVMLPPRCLLTSAEREAAAAAVFA